MDITEDIALMCSIKENLIQLDIEKNNDYINILDSITKYIEKYCHHDIIDDDIDITPEKSMRIHYCNKCMTTFHSK